MYRADPAAKIGRLSAELARRLVHSGVAPEQVETLLLEAVNRGISLAQALHETQPGLVDLLERALDRSEYPAVHRVRPLPELVRALPPGLCERLLSLPVYRDPRSDRVDVASADVLDAHVASEFAFHLGVPIRVLRAPFVEIIDALKELHAAGIFLPGLSRIAGAEHLIQPFVPGERAERESEAPIPLLKKSPAPNRTWVPDAPAVSYGVQEPSADDGSPEPVLSLRRSKPFSAPSSELGGPPWALEFEAAVAALDSADTPEHVVASLCEGLRPVRALVFAIRNTGYEVRGGSAALGTPAELRTIHVPAGAASLLDVALRSGFYLGPFTQLSTLTLLDGKWGARPGSDCYARVVNVSGRPSLMVLMAGFSESTEATRRADVLCSSAGSALERIVRSRKKN